MAARLPDKAPRYASIAQEILEGIEGGRYPVGALLPTEHALCEMFGVSRVTIRGALRELDMRGFISRQPGVGTRVDRTAPRDRFVHESSSVEDVLQFTQDMTFRVLSSNEIVADDALAHRAACRVGDRFLRVEGLRLATSGVPVCLSTHAIAGRFAGFADRLDGLKGSLVSAIAGAFRLEIGEVDQTIEAENLSDDQARLLQATAGEAALSTWRRYRATDGALLVASHSMFPKDRYSYSLQIRRDRGVDALSRGQGGRA